MDSLDPAAHAPSDLYRIDTRTSFGHCQASFSLAFTLAVVSRFKRNQCSCAMNGEPYLQLRHIRGREPQAQTSCSHKLLSSALSVLPVDTFLFHRVYLNAVKLFDRQLPAGDCATSQDCAV